MHELSITQNILDIALAHAPAERRITKLHLVIGDMSSIVDESVQFYWDIIARGTAAEGATLYFERLPTRMFCVDCQREYTPPAGQLTCPHCEGAHVKLCGGDEFRLQSIDIE